MRLKKQLGVTACTLICMAFPQISYADDIFKGSEFLTWERANQDFYIKTSIGMANLVVAQNDENQAQCVDKWYYSDEKAKNSFILETMRKNPEYHPRGVILGVLQKQCGQFKYK